MISEWPERAVLVVAEDDGEWHSRWPGDKWLTVEETKRDGPKEEEYNAWRVDVGMILASFSGNPAYGGWFELDGKTTHAYAARDIKHRKRDASTGPWDFADIDGVYTLFDLDRMWLITHLMANTRAAWHAHADLIQDLGELVRRRDRIDWPKTPRPAPATGEVPGG